MTSLIEAKRLLVQGDAGAVTVLVAFLLPVLILIGSIVVDSGDWYQQSRHLQLQADAGALAGALDYQAGSCSDTTISADAQQYSGISGATVYNQIDGNSTGITERINSSSYAAQGNPPATDSIDAKLTGSPCNDGVVDVKMTEGGNGSGLPWYFPLAQAVGLNLGINAHARVSTLLQTSGTGFSPLGLADPTPTVATAYFIDETNPPPKGAALASLPLTVKTTSNGQTTFSSGTSTVPVTIDRPNIGVIIALSNSSANITCGSSGVNCFDLAPGPSLIHIAGYSLAGTGSITAPRARKVTLVPNGGCADAYFAPNPGTSSCGFQVNAGIDIGSLSNVPASGPVGVTVNAIVGGVSYPLSYQATSGTTETWTGAASLLFATAGSQQVDLQVNCNHSTTGSVCSSSNKNLSNPILDVQRAYAANDTTSGPILSAYVTDGGTPAQVDQDAFEVCETQNGGSCTPNLGVTVTLGSSFNTSTPTKATMYTLNYGTGTSASQTGAITCPPGSNGTFVNMITQGCPGTYICNASVSISTTGCRTGDPTCANTNPTAGQTPAPPADCVQTNPGVSQGQIAQGLTARIEGSGGGCPNVNHWPTAGSTTLPAANDPRYIIMFVTPYGSFGASGKGYYPIEGFAEFYVMGWSKDPCTGDPAPPDGGSGQGQVWGYFVHTVLANTNATGGSACTASTFGPCIAVLTQ